MENCCVNDLGDKPHNEDLDLGVQATQDGIYKAILFFAGVRITRRFLMVTGDDLIVPRPFNETYQYKMQIIQPDGTLLEIDSCDTFAFKTYISMDAPCGTCEDEEDEEETYS